ncbi:MAG: phage tail tape measure protein [Tannerella sp.]|jgi:TP901 family phage tail tape measure protein|nr:phage tail tape measure protein [Tannerella sp.]
MGAAGNTEFIDKLVSKEALNSLDNLNEKLAASYLSMENLLKEVQALSDGYTTHGKTVSEMVKAVGKFSEIEAKKTTLDKAELTLLQEKEKLKQKVLKTEQDAERVAREKIKTQQQAAKAADQQARAEKKVKDAMNSQKGSINEMRKKMSELVAEYNRADDATRKKLAPSIKILQERINSANADIGRHQGYVGQYGKSIAGLSGKLLGAFGIVGGISMFAGSVRKAANTIIQFEQTNVNLSTILGKNVKEISALTDSAKHLGATTEWAASQVTQLQIELAKLGFSEPQILAMQTSILQFATAMDAGLSESAKLAGSVLRSFGLEAKKTEHALSVMTVASYKSALSFSDFETSVSILAPIARAYGFTIEDMSALLGTLKNAGFDASKAATATRNILLNLADSNGKLAKQMGEPVKTIPELAEALNDLSARGIDLSDTLELTDKRSVAAFNSFLRGTDGMLKLRKELENVDGELKRIQEERLQTASGSIKLLKSSWEALILSFQNSTGAIKSVVDGLTTIVDWIRRAVDAAGDFGKLAPETKWYKDIVNENKTFAVEDYANRFKKKTGEGYDVEVIYEIELAEAQKNMEEYEKELKDFMDRRERSINAGIIKNDEWSKSDADTYSRLKMHIDTYKASIEALDEVYRDFTPKAADPVQKGLDFGGEEEAKKRAEEEAKKRAELAAYRIKVEADAQKQIASDEAKSYNERYAALVSYGDKEIAYINMKRKNELSDEKLTQSGRELINLKADEEIRKSKEKLYNDIKELDKKCYEDLYKNSQKHLQDLKSGSDSAEQEELVTLSGLYASGEVKKEDYEKKRLEIGKKYSVSSFESQIAYLEQEMLKFEENRDIQEKIAGELAKAKAGYAKYAADAEVKANEEAVEKQKDAYESLKGYLESEYAKSIENIWNTLLDVADMYYDNQLSHIDELEKRESEYWENKLKMIDENVEAGLMSEETAAAQRKIIEETQLQREKQYEQQRKEMQRKQANWQKANAIIQAIINTALAFTSALSTPPAPLGIALAAIVGALGAAQIAMISSQKVPSYAKGTESHPGGLALVGDGGRPEMVVTPSGEVWKTPARDTLVSLPKGAEVLPDFRKAYADMFSKPSFAYHDEKAGMIFEHDEVLRKNAGMTNEHLSSISRGVHAIRANGQYSEKRAELLYRLNRRQHYGVN